MRRFGFTLGALVVLYPAAARAQEDERARQVFDIIKTHCLECHGESRKGSLDLRTHATLIKGGASGRVVVPHEPAKSRLFLLVSHADPDDVMPQKKPKLADQDIELIRQWIEDGASLEAVEEAVPDERKTPEALAKLEERPITPEERAYWAFRTPRKPRLPPLPSGSWGKNPIDAFLLAAMKGKGVSPSPPPIAARSFAYLDVLGLPPTPAEVDAFVRDKSPDAWPKLVDRLLASPHYGERWARHWLDLVRYADSGGFEFDVDRPESWRYRDYVVRSFNSDKPYSQFVREQVAGDEYAPGSDDAMIATGFLRLGPEGGGGGERGRQDSLDDIVTTTTLTFMGVTVACARCHNHKFDPGPQKDYYRIQAVFYSTRPAEHPLVPAHQISAHRAETQRVGEQPTDYFGRQALMARRLVERGVRFVQIFSGGGNFEPSWDAHRDLKGNHGQHCAETDKPIAGLIKDLKSRGMFESTLILWHGEFGRLPISERMDGRDHNANGFSVWLAGGGVKGGTIVGATDQYGYKAVENPKTVYELHATILRLLGLDHEALTYRFNGRDMRLTDVHGNVIKEILA